MSPWLGKVKNFVPYPLSFSSPGSSVLELPVGNTREAVASPAVV